MDINIGISEVDRARSADAVAKLLADTYTLYLKTYGYHWNVEGPHFQQLHVLWTCPGLIPALIDDYLLSRRQDYGSETRRRLPA